MPTVHVIGASGRSGSVLSRALIALGDGVVAVVRDPSKFGALGIVARTEKADLADPVALRAALHDAETIVSCAHARHAPAIIAAVGTNATRSGSRASMNVLIMMPAFWHAFTSLNVSATMYGSSPKAFL